MALEILLLLDHLAKVGLAICPVPVWMTQQKNRPSVQRWASVGGLALEPAWFWTAHRTADWGLYVATAAFTIISMQGFGTTGAGPGGPSARQAALMSRD
jgi:hypothetical protein